MGKDQLIHILIKYPEIADEVNKVILKWTWEVANLENLNLINIEIDTIIQNHISKIRENKIKEICL